MREYDLQKLMSAARARVRSARALLMLPRTCNPDECVTLLREANGYLEWLRDSIRGGGRASQNLRRHAVDLAGEIRQADALLEQAARLGRRWLGALRSMTPEYTASGGAVPVQIRGRVSYLG